MNQSHVHNAHRKALVLRNQLVEYFNMGELEDICFELGLDPENVRHNTRRELATGLLRFAATEELQDALVSTLRNLRPNVEWPDRFVFPSGTISSEELVLPEIQFGFVNASELGSSGSVPINSISLLEVQESSIEPNLQELVASEREALRLIYLDYINGLQEQQDKSDQLSVISAFYRSMQIVPKTQQQYDEECDGYLKRFEEYLLEKWNYDMYQGRFRKVRFEIANIGRVAADDILVEIHFPDEFAIMSEDDEYFIDMEFKEPVPPSRPKVDTTFLDQIRFPLLVDPAHLFVAPRAITDIEPIHGNVHGPYFERSNSTKVSFRVDKLIPKAPSEYLEEVGFMVHTSAIGKTWPLRYSIYSRQLPEPMSGELYLEVRSYIVSTA